MYALSLTDLRAYVYYSHLVGTGNDARDTEEARRAQLGRDVGAEQVRPAAEQHVLIEHYHVGLPVRRRQRLQLRVDLQGCQRRAGVCEVLGCVGCVRVCRCVNVREK